jgi:hypothetical protein
VLVEAVERNPAATRPGEQLGLVSPFRKDDGDVEPDRQALKRPLRQARPQPLDERLAPFLECHARPA